MRSEGFDWLGLVGVDLPGGYVGYVVVLAVNLAATQAAHHGELAGVGEGICDRALEERFGGGLKRSTGGEVVVEGTERREEAGLLLGPPERGGVVPALASLHRAECPVEEVAHVGEDLDGLAAATIEGGEAVGSAFECTAGAIGKGGEGVAQEFAFLVHAANIAQSQAGDGKQQRCTPRG